MAATRREKILRLTTDTGFSLIEVCVGIVILTVGLLAMASVLISILNGNTFSRKLSTATVLAKSKLEDIEAVGYMNISSSDTTQVEDYQSIPNYPGFKRTTSIDTDNPAAGMKKITVTIYWESDARSTSIQTILTR